MKKQKLLTLVSKLLALIAERGNVKVELETLTEIVAPTSVRFADTDAKRGPTIILRSNGATL